MTETTTVRCGQGHTNPAGQRYCGECGASLAGLCPNGHVNPPGQHFCGECGTALTSSPESSETERGRSDAKTGGDPFGPRFRVHEDGVVQDDDAEGKEKSPTAPPPPKQSQRGTASAPSTPKPLRVGTTFTTRGGSQATITKIAGDSVWLTFDGDGAKLGRLRFPRKDVEAALASGKSFTGNSGSGEPRKAPHAGSAAAPPRAPTGAGHPTAKKATQSAAPPRAAQPARKRTFTDIFGIHPLLAVGIGVAIVFGVIMIVLVNKSDPSISKSGSSGGSRMTTSTERTPSVEERNYLAKVRNRSGVGWSSWPDNATLLEQGRIICTDLGNHRDLMWQAEVMGYISWHPNSPPLPTQDDQAEFQILEAMSYLCNGVR